MQKIGFIGLGIMGGPMAANLVKAGYDVIGFARSATSTDRLHQAGAKPASSIAEATRGADVVITMLPDSPDVEAVVLGPEGVLDAASEGLLLIDMSTIAPATSLAVAEAARAKGVRALDAPVSGGEDGAIEGTLSIMVGGEAEDFAAARAGPRGHGQDHRPRRRHRLRPDRQGRQPVARRGHHHAGQRGAGAARSLGSGRRAWPGGARGRAGRERHPRPEGGHHAGAELPPGFRIDLHHKDMGIAQASARAAGVALPVTGQVAQLVAAAQAMGYGAQDHSALLQVIEQLSGRNTD